MRLTDPTAGDAIAPEALQALNRFSAAQATPAIAQERTKRLSLLVIRASQGRASLDYLLSAVERVFDHARLDAGEFVLNPSAGSSSTATTLKMAVRNARRTMISNYQRLQALLDGTPESERLGLLLSMESSTPKRLKVLRQPIAPRLLISATDEERRIAAAATSPDNGTLFGVRVSGSSQNVAGVALREAVSWSVSFSPKTLHLPPGAEVTAFSPGGELAIEGERVLLPGETTLVSGRIRQQQAELLLSRDAVVDTGLMRVRSRYEGMKLRVAGSTIVAGPMVTIALDVLQATDVERALATGGVLKTANFNLENAKLPGGIELRSGQGSMKVLLSPSGDDGKLVPLGMVKGSVVLREGSETYLGGPANGDAPVNLPMESEVDVALLSGRAILRDGQLKGLLRDSVAQVGDVTFKAYNKKSTAFSNVMVLGAADYQFAGGAVITELPEQGRVVLRGEQLELRSLGGLSDKVTVARGGVVIENGIVSSLLPESEITIGKTSITAAANSVDVLSSPPLDSSRTGNWVAVEKDIVTAAGDGFKIAGGDHEALLPSGNDFTFYLPNRTGIELRDGAVEIRRRYPGPGKIGGLEITSSGKYSLNNGRFSVDFRASIEAAREQQANWKIEDDLASGVFMNIVHEGRQYESDIRPLWGDNVVGADPGRFREVPKIENPDRFGGALEELTSTIKRGDVILSGDVGVDDAHHTKLFRHIQESLVYFMDAPLPLTGKLDDDTQGLLRRFQRVSGITPTGFVDAATMSRIDQIRAPVDLEQIVRVRGGTDLRADERAFVKISLDNTVLRSGDRGEAVKSVQMALNESVMAGLVPDGIFGRRSAEAAAAFQRQSGLPETGEIDAMTLAELVEVPEIEMISGPVSRPRVMVMVATNNEVPDEFERFKTLARERGAKAVIIGPEDSEYTEIEDMRRFFARAEAGKIDLDWITLSGHSTGISTWGELGELEYSDLQNWTSRYPRAAAQIEKLSLLNCYNVTRPLAEGYWPTLFPNVSGLVGFMYSAPGKKSQSSDEHLLNSGRLLASIGKGELISSDLAQDLGRRYSEDSWIKHMNASAWFRHQGDVDDDRGHFALTASAAVEMRSHGASGQLEMIPIELREAFDNYLAANNDDYAEPSHDHRHPLRRFLNAVTEVRDAATVQVQRYERFEQRRERHYQQQGRLEREADNRGESFERERFETPEEFELGAAWETQLSDVRDLRDQALFLIYHDRLRVLFGERYARNIDALNDLLAENGTGVGFATPDELAAMNRKQTLEMLDAVQAALSDRVDADTASQNRDADGWQMIAGVDDDVYSSTSATGFLGRANDFLRDMKSDVIDVAWL